MIPKLRRIASSVYHKTVGIGVYHLKLYLYWKNLPQKVSSFRNKDKIKTLFVISALNSWKTEALYCAMSAHSRFDPYVGICSNINYPYAKEDIISYLNTRGYKYVDLDNNPNSIKAFNPDLVFYGSPYPMAYPKGLYFKRNLEFVFCGVDYCLNITKHEIHMKHSWYDYCWQFYVEHKDVAERKKELLGYRARNIKVTGVPLQDSLMLSKENFPDPWKDTSGKKRIIYAPHHSFKGSNADGIEFATFMDYGEAMLEFAKKYQEQITIAFKPHPLLYIKLTDIWGQERTDTYYNAWREMDNTQFENGEYMGLFKHSDAIIHDCASFIIEYLYMDNPSLYLVAETNSTDDMFEFVKKGYECYEHGRCLDDIERFILEIINAEDVMKEKRHAYITTQLTPPGNQTACENIINAILMA